jgi:hypothetical protein
MREMRLIKAQADLPIPGYRIQTTTETGGAVFTVFKSQMPLVNCLLAIEPQENVSYWKMIEDMYLQLTNETPVDWALAEKPVSTPWLAVVLLPGIRTDREAAI